MSQKNVVSQGNQQLFNRNDWYFHKIACLPNSKLDWEVRGVIAGISQEFVRMGILHSELTKMWYPNIADNCGLSLDTVKSGIARLVELKAIIKEERRERNKEGIKVRRIYLCFTHLFLSDPKKLLENVEESNRGGKRIKKHKGCGGEIYSVCGLCGETNIPASDIYLEEVEEINEPQKLDLVELDNRAEQVIPTSILEMPREGTLAQEPEVETFRRAMGVARRQPRKPRYSLNKTSYLDTGEMEV